jgi:hypothetical protein
MAQPPKPLPEGDTGLAARYPGDVGLARDPAVVFAEDFEDQADAASLRARWDNVFHDATLRIVDAPGDAHAGGKAIEMTFRKSAEPVGNGLMKTIRPEPDVLFLRLYQKFDPNLDIAGAGSFHNTGSISSRYHINGNSTPGVAADGRNKFLASYEASVYSDAPPPGNLGVYVYHPGQRHRWGDLWFPTGIVQPNTSKPGDYGPGFVARPDVRPELGQWACYEIMVQANTPGRLDGRIALWLDGRLIADFPNLRLRDIPELTIDTITVGGYINPNAVRTNTIWFDDIVAATSYIGPRKAP